MKTKTLSKWAAALVVCSTFDVSFAQAQSANASDFRGYWQPSQTNNLLHTETDKTPPLTAAAREVYDSNIAKRKKGDLSFDTTTKMCFAPGIPRSLIMSPFWLLQNNEYVLMMFDRNQAKRIVYLPVDYQRINFAADQTNKDSAYLMGVSAGHWEGKTLVIDSGQYKEDTLLDEALPHSESMKVQERIQLVDANTLEDVVTITDPETFTAPWSTRLRFKRGNSNELVKEDVCVDRQKDSPHVVDAD